MYTAILGTSVVAGSASVGCLLEQVLGLLRYLLEFLLSAWAAAVPLSLGACLEEVLRFLLYGCTGRCPCFLLLLPGPWVGWVSAACWEDSLACLGLEQGLDGTCHLLLLCTCCCLLPAMLHCTCGLLLGASCLEALPAVFLCVLPAWRCLGAGRCLGLVLLLP